MANLRFVYDSNKSVLIPYDNERWAAAESRTESFIQSLLYSLDFHKASLYRLNTHSNNNLKSNLSALALSYTHIHFHCVIHRMLIKKFCVLLRGDLRRFKARKKKLWQTISNAISWPWKVKVEKQNWKTFNSFAWRDDLASNMLPNTRFLFRIENDTNLIKQALGISPVGVHGLDIESFASI